MTVTKLIKRGAKTVLKSRPKGTLLADEYEVLSDATMSYVATVQSNGDYEKKNPFMESLLKDLFKSSKKKT